MGEGARRFTEKGRQDEGGCAARPQKRQVEGVHSPGTAIALDSDQRMDRRTLGHGPPYEYVT